jgi:hypothetical protein
MIHSWGLSRRVFENQGLWLARIIFPALLELRLTAVDLPYLFLHDIPIIGYSDVAVQQQHPPHPFRNRLEVPVVMLAYSSLHPFRAPSLPSTRTTHLTLALIHTSHFAFTLQQVVKVTRQPGPLCHGGPWISTFSMVLIFCLIWRADYPLYC